MNNALICYDFYCVATIWQIECAKRENQLINTAMFIISADFFFKIAVNIYFPLTGVFFDTARRKCNIKSNVKKVDTKAYGYRKLISIAASSAT